VLAGLRARHIQVLADRTAPRCTVEVDSSGDALFDDGIAGDVIVAAPDRPLRFRVSVAGGAGQVLTVHDLAPGRRASETLSSYPIATPEFTLILERTPTAAGGGAAIFFEVGQLRTLTNPIWY
jgi:hypothetical protein